MDDKKYTDLLIGLVEVQRLYDQLEDDIQQGHERLKYLSKRLEDTRSQLNASRSELSERFVDGYRAIVNEEYIVYKSNGVILVKKAEVIKG
jgi:predicted  nucleic acid-binding Zn-ribbon protein